MTSPITTAELADALASGRAIRIEGAGTKEAWAPERPGEVVSLRDLSGITEFHPADQTVVVRAGTRVTELQDELRKVGQCLPLPDPGIAGDALAGYWGTVGGLIACDMPHGLFAQHGGPRDWVLGATFVRPGGVVAKSGSKVVKSVAGFDVHRMVVGNWGRWLVMTEVALRTFPCRALGPMSARLIQPHPGDAWIVRTLRSEYEPFLENLSPFAADPASCTIWSMTPPTNTDRLLLGPRGQRSGDPVTEVMRARLDAILDPKGVLR